MIIAGLGVILFGFGNHGQAVGISNLWKNGGFFTGGVKGFSLLHYRSSLLPSVIELIGMTAGEAENPKKTIIELFNHYRSNLDFYIGAIFIIEYLSVESIE